MWHKSGRQPGLSSANLRREYSRRSFQGYDLDELLVAWQRVFLLGDISRIRMELSKEIQRNAHLLPATHRGVRGSLCIEGPEDRPSQSLFHVATSHEALVPGCGKNHNRLAQDPPRAETPSLQGQHGMQCTGRRNEPSRRTSSHQHRQKKYALSGSRSRPCHCGMQDNRRSPAHLLAKPPTTTEPEALSTRLIDAVCAWAVWVGITDLSSEPLLFRLPHPSPLHCSFLTFPVVAIAQAQGDAHPTFLLLSTSLSRTQDSMDMSRD